MISLAFLSSITASQLIAHALGDYLFQTSWMAMGKTQRWLPAIVHGCVYGLVYWLVLQPSPQAMAVIVGTHILIDRFRLARYICWTKEFLTYPFQRPKPWKDCSKTGFDPNTPTHLADWLMIIIDNIMHVCINAWALYYLLG